MKITETFAEEIINGFRNGSTGRKVALGSTAVLWGPFLLVGTIVEKSLDIPIKALETVSTVGVEGCRTVGQVGTKATGAIKRIGGRTGDAAFRKVDEARKIKAGVHGVGIDVQFKDSDEKPARGASPDQQPHRHDIDN